MSRLHLHEQNHHQATDGLVNLFSKANHDLLVVQYRLEKEFQQIYPDNVSPKSSVSLQLILNFEIFRLKRWGFRFLDFIFLPFSFYLLIEETD